MKRRPYKAKNGAKQFRPIISEADLERGNMGFCLACGVEAEGVEPDGRKYECEHCHAPKVYGLEELAMMGLAVMKEAA